MNHPVDLYSLLRTHWGYHEFRPKQEPIVTSILEGRDVAVVMPTGGGKSLCYQLPALVSGRTTIVISPLISLMQDQCAQLAEMGISAGVLNSTQAPHEQSAAMKAARDGAYSLLYLSPERLAREDTVAWLRRVPVGFFAIDEAHCISEWGHEFRPEYRQLNRLRTEFPDIPIASFTASATQRVRHDILAQLHLRDPKTFIMSFFRSNLRYTIHQCKSGEQDRQLLAALKAHDCENIIVYAPTIARVEDTADYLCSQGIPALPYHGKMEPPQRKANQERWMSDEVRVIVGTIAFGLGINKPNVRAVVHLSMPKSIEQYYQEAGRAGRDGLPADCVLLWQKADAGLLAYFIDQMRDPAERSRSWDRYHQIRSLVDNSRCRHLQICNHFGETPKWSRCEACDVCLGKPDWLVSAGSKKEALKPPVNVRRSESKASTPQVPNPLEPDPELVEYLREWRRETAAARGVPAFVILHDATLVDLCRRRPGDLTQLLEVSGIGKAKAESLGPDLLGALARFESGARAKTIELSRTPVKEDIQRMLAEGLSFIEIAKRRERQVETIISHVADMIESGVMEFQPSWVSEPVRTSIEELAQRLGFERLKPIKEALPETVTYPEIRLVVAALRRTTAEKS